jgi:hypothetical protein
MADPRRREPTAAGATTPAAVRVVRRETMHPYINKQLIDDRHRRYRDEADADRLMISSRPRRRWFRRSRQLAAVPPQVEANPPVPVDEPVRPVA